MPFFFFFFFEHIMVFFFNYKVWKKGKRIVVFPLNYLYIYTYIYYYLNIRRHIIILFDMSSSMKERDLKPDRINVALECVEVIRFIKIKRNNK